MTVKAEPLQHAPWSACLLIKDSNIILPEWLAYHYTTLPLRRLIVAIDPKSTFDPSYIFNQYESIGMNTTIWTDDDYWVDGPRFHEKRNFTITNDTLPAYAQDRLVYRQKIFYHGCLMQLKEEKQKWTAVIDADEYIAFNYLDERSLEGVRSGCGEREIFIGNSSDMQNHCEETCSAKNLTCLLPRKRVLTPVVLTENDKVTEFYDCILPPPCDSEYRRKSFRTRLNQSATVSEHIHKHIDRSFDSHDCIVLARYLFSSNETDSKIIEEGVDDAFNATLFHTLRYRFRTDLEDRQPGKSIVDVSRYGGNPILSPHRLHRKCLTENRAYPDNYQMSLRVHHYVGSWESFRLRGYDQFEQRNKLASWVVDDTTPKYTASGDGTISWLSQFAALVGREKALELTEKIRVHEEREVERYLDRKQEQ